MLSPSVFGLVDLHLDTARRSEVRDVTVAVILRLGVELDAALAQLRHRAFDVVAIERDAVRVRLRLPRFVEWVDAEVALRQVKDQPAAADIGSCRRSIARRRVGETLATLRVSWTR